MDEEEIEAAADAAVAVIAAETEHDVAVIEAAADAAVERDAAWSTDDANAAAGEALDTANDAGALAAAALAAVEQVTVAVGDLTIAVAELRGRIDAQANAPAPSIEVEAEEGAVVDLTVLDDVQADDVGDEPSEDEAPDVVHPYWRKGAFKRRR